MTGFPKPPSEAERRRWRFRVHKHGGSIYTPSFDEQARDLVEFAKAVGGFKLTNRQASFLLQNMGAYGPYAERAKFTTGGKTMTGRNNPKQIRAKAKKAAAKAKPAKKAAKAR